MAKTRKKNALKSAAKKSSKAATKATRKSAKMTAKAKTKPLQKAKKATVRRKIDPLNRERYGPLTPMLAVRDVRKAANFYVQAFGFKIREINEGPGGQVIHAELRFREATLMLSPESREQNSLSASSIGNTPATLYILVEDVDKIFQQATGAGAQTLMPVGDMFWGDRCCMVADPDGNKWMVATHKSEPTEAEMRAEMERQMQAQQAPAAPESAVAAAAGAESIAESEY